MSIITAITRRDEALLVELLEDGHNPNGPRIVDECVHALLRFGADVEIQSRFGAAPLATAASLGNAACLLELIKAGADAHACKQDQLRQTALHHAARGGHVECLEALLECGAYMDRTDGMAHSSLHLAASIGSSSCTRVLLDAGVDVECSSQSMLTPLHVAAMHGRASCLRALARAGCDLNSLSKRNMTALHYAAVHDDGSSVLPTGVTNTEGLAECVRVLVRAGADVDVQDEYNETPLHHAARYGDVTSVRTLLRAGADTGRKNDEMKIPFDVAKEELNADAAKLLEAYNPRRLQALRWRRAMEATRDAKAVFQAASEGRPLELAKRLRLGQLAGGLEMKGKLPGSARDTVELMDPLQAAREGGHVECVRVIEEALAQE